jgi:iron(III) transport system substrate-binding protein
MRVDRFLLRTWALLGLLACCDASVAGAEAVRNASAAESLALYDGADRQERLVEAAKKEGELTLYTVTPGSNSDPVIAAFTKKYRIKVNLWRASSEVVLNRIVTEARGGRFDVDVNENNTLENEALHREQLLQAVRSPYAKDLMPQASAPHRQWVGTVINIWIAAYNTGLIKERELPGSYDDLLDARWKGRLGIEASNYAWFATVTQALGAERALKTFGRLVETNGLSVRKGHSLLTGLVASGEIPLALTVYNWNVPVLEKKGAPIKGLMLAPLAGQFRTVALQKKAPHPNAALLFYDFMLNEGQQILAALGEVVPSRNIDSPYTRQPIAFIDPGEALDKGEQWQRTWDDVVLKRAR